MRRLGVRVPSAPPPCFGAPASSSQADESGKALPPPRGLERARCEGLARRARAREGASGAFASATGRLEVVAGWRAPRAPGPLQRLLSDRVPSAPPPCFGAPASSSQADESGKALPPPRGLERARCEGLARRARAREGASGAFASATGRLEVVAGWRAPRAPGPLQRLLSDRVPSAPPPCFGAPASSSQADESGKALPPPRGLERARCEGLAQRPSPTRRHGPRSPFAPHRSPRSPPPITSSRTSSRTR